ncbi:MAG: site-specific DNA-methyltransferase [Amphiplicatus sp.]
MSTSGKPLLAIEHHPISALTPYVNNPRTHSKEQIRLIAESIKAFGWTNPVLIDDEGGVIAGHGRIEAAKLLGLAEVPTIRLSAMSPAQKRAYVIADNRLAERAGWDRDLLKIELEGLLEMDLDFRVETIGFETAEIDLFLGEKTTDADDDVPPVEDAPPTSIAGDLWLLGEHRLYCGDALDPESYEKVLGNEKARAVFTDPPYNVRIDGHVSGLGRVRHDEFVMASGEMNEDEFARFLKRTFDNLAAFTLDGAIAFVCMDWRHAHEMLVAGRAAFAELKNICIWNKTNGGMGSLYRSKHELVFVFKNGAAPHINNVELGRFGRYRTNVWDYAGANSFGTSRLEDLADHPTVKPVALVADALQDVTQRGDLVLDSFCGSGSTIIAAERSSRRAAAIELDPKFVDVAIRRFEKAAGVPAVNSESGKTFEQTRIDRAFERAMQ